VQKAGSRKVSKKTDRPVAKNPRQIILPDLSINDNTMQCNNHSASMTVMRSGGPILRSFVVRLLVYRGTTPLEEIRRTIAPFSGSSKSVSFQTKTDLHNTENDITFCLFTVDPDKLIDETRDNNNDEMKVPPREQNVPNE
jgi:hypothetical protein